MKENDLEEKVRLKNYFVDVPVLMIFFNRPEKFAKVFAQVKKARPSKLYLYQDGARGERDTKLIEACRKIVEDIDWKCEVYKYFQDKNMGCDPSIYIAIKWMFEKENKGIILEDDAVPEVSFFEFCRELLEKYMEDERIGMICGSNPLYAYTEQMEEDYIFTNSGAIWGWATWKRVTDAWDRTYSYVHNKKIKRLLSLNTQFKKNCEAFLKNSQWHAESGKEYFESIHGAEMRLNYHLAIVPKHNLITNIGVGGESTHSVSNIKLLPKGILAVFNVPTSSMDFPLTHPRYKLPDKIYERKINRLIGYALHIRAWRKCSILFRKALYGRKSK